ncbi:hypothetical protein [Paraburkholderia caballeronis]|uniref:hypothetical protein n=1 Tax=Paraburkholderia caballeronis TaxID=416943 RepID=UPI0010659282|nr:hypothetical protein [Paraburkholderia caballeronis]TDV06027.1 hypothetical protein C7408_1248 [Paraburkholderia caballeronis]TDV09567.1 hypothetical protein C7406_1268 [Paraburkholderia caballeronis]TDV21632.1 hypothetical protein C7404_1218 [Paraburkholderia caballeronis]
MSEKINNGGPAFPIPLNEGQSYQGHAPCDGMTLRDYFAAKALSGLLAEPLNDGDLSSAIHCTSNFDMDGAQPGDRIATAAYAIADAMLRARGAA